MTGLCKDENTSKNEAFLKEIKADLIIAEDESYIRGLLQTSKW